MLSARPGLVAARSSRPVAPLHLRPRIGAESICEQQSISAGAALSPGEQLTVRGRGSRGVGGGSRAGQVVRPSGSLSRRPSLSKKLFPVFRVGTKTASREVGIFFFFLISFLYRLECTGGGSKTIFLLKI